MVVHMDHLLRRPEEILAYRSLKQILAGKPKALWTVGSKDNALSAMRLMAEKNIGLVVVMEGGAIVGVLSERDCFRRLVLAGKSPEATPVADIMVRDVIKADTSSTLAPLSEADARAPHSSSAGGRKRRVDRGYLDPRSVERGGGAPRKSH
jgi:hypothetical protein